MLWTKRIHNLWLPFPLLHHHHHHQRNAAQGFLPTAVGRPLLLCLERLVTSMAGGEVCGEGAARRRRERRLRSWLRHERQSVAMALVEQKHHASWGQMRARAREVEKQDQHEALRRQRAPPPGKRPGVLKDPEPKGRMGQHCGVGYELVQALDVLVLQMVEQHVEMLSFLRSSLPAVPEQVIEVPILSLPVCAVQRGSPRTADGGTVGGSADAVLHLRAER